MRSPLALSICLSALLLDGCVRDRLQPETLRCAVDANREKALWYTANAAHLASGSLIVTLDTSSGRTRSLVTRQNFLCGAYALRSDELFITGFWVLPRIERDISVVR